MSVCTENNVFGVFFVISGALETLSTQWAEHTNGTGSKSHEFHHPFFVQCGKFFGELFCLLLYGIVFGRCGNGSLPPMRRPNLPRTPEGGESSQQNRQQNYILPEIEQPSWSIFLFLPCALCDLAKTGMLYVGLRLTYPSSFMMLQGSVLFFTALLSVAFLARNLQTQMWVGIGVSIGGMALLGLRDYVFWRTFPKFDSYGIAAGDLLIVMAQIMVATRVVLEQKFVTKHNIHPLYAVGLEGLFGFILSVIFLIAAYFIPAGHFSKLPGNRLEDSLDAFMQLKSTWQIALAFIGSVVSVSLYYYFGIDFAKKHGAISRMVLDSFTCMVAWTFFFGLGWQKFHPLILPGFVLVIVGMMIYNDVLFYPLYMRFMRRYYPDRIRDQGLPPPRPLQTANEDQLPLLGPDATDIQDGREGPGGPPRAAPRGRQNIPC